MNMFTQLIQDIRAKNNLADNEWKRMPECRVAWPCYNDEAYSDYIDLLTEEDIRIYDQELVYDSVDQYDREWYLADQENKDAFGGSNWQNEE